MKRTIHHPSSTLAPYIDHYILFELNNQQPALSFRDFPRTAMDMIFFSSGYAEITLPDASQLVVDNCAFISLFDTHYNVSVSKGAKALMVRFKANGIYPLTAQSMKVAVNNQFPLADFLEKNTADVHEQIVASTTAEEKIKRLESWLLPYYQREELHFRLDHGLQLINNSQGRISVKTLSEALNSNYKSLDRWFLKKVGINPKKFIQLARFKYIIAELDKTEQVDWLQIVERYGFHDQAHFTKSFKRFAGISPSIYHSQYTNSSF